MKSMKLQIINYEFVLYDTRLSQTYYLFASKKKEYEVTIDDINSLEIIFLKFPLSASFIIIINSLVSGSFVIP